MTLRRQAFERVSHLVPDVVLAQLRRGATPFAAWLAYRQKTVFDVAHAVAECDTDAARDAFAMKLNRIANGESPMSPMVASRVGPVLDVPDWFLYPEFYQEFGIQS